MTGAPIVVFLAALALSGCVKQDEVYAPPHQRHPLAGPDTSRIRHFIAMNDPDAMAHVVRDVNDRLEGGLWRWTAQRPLLRFILPTTNRLKLVIDFTIPVDVIAQTGPLTVTYFINTHQIDRITYDKAGEQHFEKAVDPAWLIPGGDTLVSAELSKVFVGQDGARLGLALVRAGFRE